MSYNPKLDKALAMAHTTYNKHSEDIERFVFDYKIQELYDDNGELYQQLTPYLLIVSKR